MILVSGATGFVGQVLVRHLIKLGYSVKLLMRPSKTNPNLPKGLTMEVALSSLQDEKGLRAAMKGVDVVYHLASAESLGRRAELEKVDIQGTQAIVNAAANAGVERFINLSHLGADRASAYPLLKSKAIVEHIIRQSGIPYTIFKSAVVYGKEDHFTNGLAFLLKVSPIFVMLPDMGTTLLQPIWIDDLVTAMTWALEMPQTRNRTIEVGGPEHLSFRQICEMIMDMIHIRRKFINVSPVLLNVFTEILEILIPNFPISVFWLDYLASNRTTDLDVLPREFNLLPARMSQQIDYLKDKSLRKNWWRIIFQRR